ncbi:MAG: helix-turn-helix domain-containing protein [Gammaproteobacteria bacterium]|nr:helix-turn-helix domain-containing protein [Gammaproteobacteria bacterium]
MTTEKTESSATPDRDATDDVQLGDFITEVAAAMTQGALQLAARTSEVPLRMARAVLADRRDPEDLKPDNLKLMYDAGVYLRDLRNVTGLTLNDLAAALDMKDSTLLESVEAGAATLPFETILRLASLVARNDPVPFVIRMIRSYNPEAWEVLQNWGIGRLPLQLERERQFINIYRGNDQARDLGDAEFQKVVEFTRSAFEMAMQFSEGPEENQ